MPTTKNGNSFLDVFDSKSLWHTSWLAQSVERLGGRELCQGSLDCEVGGNGLGGWTWESKRQSVASISLLARRTTVISVFSLLLFLPPCWFYASRTTQGRLGRLPNDSRKIPPLILLHLFPPFISLTPGLSVGARAPYGSLFFPLEAGPDRRETDSWFQTDSVGWIPTSPAFKNNFFFKYRVVTQPKHHPELVFLYFKVMSI